VALSQWVIDQEVKITAQLHTVPLPSRRSYGDNSTLCVPVNTALNTPYLLTP